MIETIDDILEDLADQVGVYGTHNENESRHCRICWTAELRQRIREAVDVAMKLGTWVLVFSFLLPASPLLSDGDETTSVGTSHISTSYTITPHPAWAQPLEGTSWISIAQTGWPLLTWLPNGTVISFSETFSLASMPSFAMVTFAADDSAALFINRSLVIPEALTLGNTYSTCSDFGVTCREHTVVDILPWLTLGENEIRFDVAQRGGYSFGLNYSVGLGWLDEPLATPEPGTWITGLALAVIVALGVIDSRWEAHKIRALDARVDRLTETTVRYRSALTEIVETSGCSVARQVAREALEEK